MTTGRINQVTTLADDQNFVPSRRLSLGNRPNAERDRSRVVQLALPNLLSATRISRRGNLRSKPSSLARRCFFAPPERPLRGRNTQDGRVRIAVTRDRYTVRPAHVLSVTLTAEVRFSPDTPRTSRASHGRAPATSSPRENTRRIGPLPSPTHIATTLFADPFAPALTYKVKPLY
jgi:hypothetical protein